MEGKWIPSSPWGLILEVIHCDRGPLLPTFGLCPNNPRFIAGVYTYVVCQVFGIKRSAGMSVTKSTVLLDTLDRRESKRCYGPGPGCGAEVDFVAALAIACAQNDGLLTVRKQPTMYMY